jgi:hypothetical protein
LKVILRFFVAEPHKLTGWSHLASRTAIASQMNAGIHPKRPRQEVSSYG